MASCTGTASGSGPTSRENAPAKPNPSGNACGRSASAARAVARVVSAAKTPGGTATTDPSVPWATPPSGPSVTGPGACGASTRTVMTDSAGPLMTVTVAVPSAWAVARPSGVTDTTPTPFTK